MIIWQRLESKVEDEDSELKWIRLLRAPVPGGWLVVAQRSYDEVISLAFVPDAAHAWDDPSL